MKEFNLWLIGMFFLTVVQAQHFTLVKDGKSSYKIVILEMPNAVEV
jgi:hypothetical protein